MHEISIIKIYGYEWLSNLSIRLVAIFLYQLYNKLQKLFYHFIILNLFTLFINIVSTLKTQINYSRQQLLKTN
jgi:hypothetical protein